MGEISTAPRSIRAEFAYAERDARSHYVWRPSAGEPPATSTPDSARRDGFYWRSTDADRSIERGGRLGERGDRGQVCWLSAASGKRDRAGPSRRASPNSPRFSFRPRAWPFARNRAAAVARRVDRRDVRSPAHRAPRGRAVRSRHAAHVVRPWLGRWLPRPAAEIGETGGAAQDGGGKNPQGGIFTRSCPSVGP